MPQNMGNANETKPHMLECLTTQNDFNEWLIKPKNAINTKKSITKSTFAQALKKLASISSSACLGRVVCHPMYNVQHKTIHLQESYVPILGVTFSNFERVMTQFVRCHKLKNMDNHVCNKTFTMVDCQNQLCSHSSYYVRRDRLLMVNSTHMQRCVFQIDHK